jgi:hypothetical protein
MDSESRQVVRRELFQVIHREMSPDPRWYRFDGPGLALPRRRRRSMARIKANRLWREFRLGKGFSE